MMSRNPNLGFTLIELMVSLFIFTIISIAALTSFQHWTHVKETQSKHAQFLESLSLAYGFLYQDFAQILTVKSGSETSVYWDDNQISFYRSAIEPFTGADMIKVAYLINPSTIVRSTGNTKQVILKDVDNIRIEWISNNKIWSPLAQELTKDESLLGIKLTFTHPTWGNLEWIFQCRH